MKTIHKQLLKAFPGVQRVTLPKDALLLNVGIQQGQLVFWYSTDTDCLVLKEYDFAVCWTGQPMPADVSPDTGWYYEGSHQADGLVHHVFSKKVI